jgi:hypothetical protein
LTDKGFSEVTIRKEKEILLPDEMLLNYLSPAELMNFKNSHIGIYSITVTGNKS